MNQKEEAIKKKWVVHISNRELDKNEILLLWKGLNFTITLQSIPTKEILALIKSDIDGLPKQCQDIIRSEIWSNLKQPHPPRQQNLTTEERKASKALKGDESVFVIKAHKRNCTVIMDRTDYNNQVRIMLQDSDVYQPVMDKRQNPTSRTEGVVQKKLLDLKKQGNLTE